MIILKYLEKNKEGLAGKFKILGQVILGLIVGLSLYFSSEAIIRENVNVKDLSAREKNGTS